MPRGERLDVGIVKMMYYGCYGGASNNGFLSMLMFIVTTIKERILYVFLDIFENLDKPQAALVGKPRNFGYSPKIPELTMTPSRIKMPIFPNETVAKKQLRLLQPTYLKVEALVQRCRAAANNTCTSVCTWNSGLSNLRSNLPVV
jgi:hypothetical protein